MGDNVNKNDLVSFAAGETGLTKTDLSKAFDAFLQGITATLKAGNEVNIVGFGKFYATDRAAGEGRNPKTGETIKIAASRQPKFKAGKGLKDAVN